MYEFMLPSGQEVELTELTGREEELLTNQKLIKKGEAINRVLLNCTRRIGDNSSLTMNDILDLLSGDRLFILTKLRQISIGQIVELNTYCHRCHSNNNQLIDLEELPVTAYPDEREFSFQLPVSSKEVIFCYLDGHKEKQLTALKDPNLTAAMLTRIVTIDGQAPNKKVVMELSMRDRSELRRVMANVDAGINTEIEIICDECGNHFKTRLEGERDFLFPGLD